MDNVVYSYDPRVQEAALEDFEEDRYVRFLSPARQAARWQHEDGEAQARHAVADIVANSRARG